MPDFSIALSGLKSTSTALNTIANNLTNMNTTGYKEQTTTFSSMLSQEVGASGSGNPIQVGSGVQVASNTTNFNEGTLSSTGVASDAAINGTGYFVLDNSGSQLYTRDGEFQVSKTGTLESASGQAVMGYSATKGVVNTTGGLTDITIPTTSSMAASATTTFSVTQNLNSSADVGTSTTGTVTVYDSLGASHDATITYTKTATNTWTYAISMPEKLTSTSKTTGSGATAVQTDTYTFGSSSVDVNTGTSLTITATDASGVTTTSTLPTFSKTGTDASGNSVETLADYASDLNGVLATTGVTASVSGGVLTLKSSAGTTFTSSGSVIQDSVASKNASGTLNFDTSGNLSSPGADVSDITFDGFTDGSAKLSMTWDMYGTSGSATISQTSSTSTQSNKTQDGYASGSYKSFSIDSTGEVAVLYSNGQTQVAGQLAVATVSNEQGLESVGSNNYQTTSASGDATVGVAGVGGRGSIQGSYIEKSNVDISTEFSDLIIAQRAFEANSKSITTFDTVTQQAINMIH